MPAELEFLNEEKEMVWHEKQLQKLADREYRSILKRIAAGYKPDIIDRILLRMARRKRVNANAR